METIRPSTRRPFFSDYLLEPILKRRRTAAADPLEFNDPETIRDFLAEQNLPLYPDIIYLSDSDSDSDDGKDQDTDFISGEDSIRPHFFADDLGSVTDEDDLRETTHGYSGDRSSAGFSTDLATRRRPFRGFRPAQCSSDFSDVSDGDGEGSGESAVTSDERTEAENVEREGDNFVLVHVIMP